jgi:hypothetical protein
MRSGGRSGSERHGRVNVGLSEDRTSEEQRLRMDPGERTGEAVAEVQPGRASPLPYLLKATRAA